MTDPFATVAEELPRDRWGRPLITPPDGTDPIAYMRCTTFVKVTEDTYHLGLWQMRMVALGMSRRKDLQLAASAVRDPKDRFQKRTLNDIAKSAQEAAKGSAAATTGTALHSLTEDIDLGRELLYVPEEHEADLAAYREITEPYAFPLIEGFCVRDDLRVGGSFDRVFTLKDPSKPLIAPDGEEVTSGIWDLKTGGSMAGGLFGMGSIAMQLGVYRNSVLYEHTLGTRTPLDDSLSSRWGIVCHLPAGTGQVQLLWVDIAAGWEIAHTVAPVIHAWRKRKDLSAPFARASANAETLALPELIARATSYDALQALHSEHRMVWTPGLTAAAKSRRAELEASA